MSIDSIIGLFQIHKSPEYIFPICEMGKMGKIIVFSSASFVATLNFMLVACLVGPENSLMLFYLSFSTQDLLVCPFVNTTIQFTHLQHISHTLHPPGTPPATHQFQPCFHQKMVRQSPLLLSTLSHLTVFQAFVLVIIIIIIIIIIYHDFLPTPRRGSHVKSGKTHTQSSRYTP